ncbi:Trimethyllysine dioxygenase [Mortierella sp. GBAus27b]|nr:Trimethyllysine dioxygenase [Mortierella sp. GBAus27b]
MNTVTPLSALRRLVSPATASKRLAALQRPSFSTRARLPAISPRSLPHIPASSSAILARSSASFWSHQRHYSAAVNENTQLAQGDQEPGVEVFGKKVHLVWPDGITSRFHSFWLRDHCHCSECYHTVTKQRLMNTFQIPRDIKPKSVMLTPTGLEVTWDNDDHKSHYSYNWLQNHSYDPKLNDPFKSEGAEKITWDNSIASQLPEVTFKDVMESDRGLAEWLNNIHIFGFSFVNGVPVSTEATEALAKRIAFIRETHYGGFWDFTSDLGHGDTAYTDIPLGAHTDTTYFTDPAGLQMFHLLYHDGEGGHNLLVDGFHCAKVLKEKHPQSYKTLSEIGVPSHSAGDVATHIIPSPRRNPILNIDPNTQELVQIRFNNDDRSTLDHLEPDQVEAFYSALFDWNKIVTDEKNMLWTKFQPGRAVIFDNWRVLHGRSGFTGKRRLCGAYTNWDDYRSRWRTLNATPEQLNEGL